MSSSNSPTDARRPRKRERTAGHLSATAFALFERHGFADVTMEQIAAEAGVAKATLYAHFPVKEALLAHRLREDIAAGMQERAAALAKHRTFESRMRWLLTESAQWNSARRAYLPAYIRYLTSQARFGEAGVRPATSKAAPIENGTRTILTAMFTAARWDGEIDARLEPATLAISVEYLLLGAVSSWLEDPSTDLRTRFLAAFDLAMHGMAARPKRRGGAAGAATPTPRKSRTGAPR